MKYYNFSWTYKLRNVSPNLKKLLHSAALSCESGHTGKVITYESSSSTKSQAIFPSIQTKFPAELSLHFYLILVLSILKRASLAGDQQVVETETPFFHPSRFLFPSFPNYLSPIFLLCSSHFMPVCICPYIEKGTKNLIFKYAALPKAQPNITKNDAVSFRQKEISTIQITNIKNQCKSLPFQIN